MGEKKRISMLLDVRVIEKVKKEAKKENRTMSNYIETVLKEKLNA